MQTLDDTPPLPLATPQTVLELSDAGRSYSIVLPHTETDLLQQRLVSERLPYELEMLRNIGEHVSPGDLILDIGANVGNHTLYLAAVCGCKVKAFEPNPELCSALRESIRLNRMDGTIHLYEMGVGKEPASAHFAKLTPENLGAQFLEIGEGEFQVVPLDDIEIKEPVRVLKIDVEGMELAVLQGACRLLTQDKPLIYAECQTEAHYAEVSQHLAQLGYIYWDSFNATPTHLFISRTQVSDEIVLRHLQDKNALGYHRSNAQQGKLRRELRSAKSKYRKLNRSFEEYKNLSEALERKLRGELKYAKTPLAVRIYQQLKFKLREKHRRD